MLNVSYVVLFLLVCALVVATLHYKEPENEADQLVEALNSHDDFGFLVVDKVDKEKLEHFASTDYEKIKKELDIDADFSVYFQDENGNIVAVTNKYCVGSNRSSVANVRCI